MGAEGDTEFYEETNEEVVETPDGADDETKEEPETPPAEGGNEGTPDPWAWAEGQDPDKVRKTWEKFTESWEETKREADRLAPLRELENDLRENPALQQHIVNFYQAAENGRSPEQQIEELAKEVNTFKRNVAIEREMEELKVTVKNQGWPDFEEIEVLKHAATSGAGSLAMAYKDMNLDKIVEAERTKLEGKLKDNANAPSMSGAKNAGSGANKSPTLEEMENMTNEEFKARFGK